MKLSELIKNNLKVIIIMSIVIVLSAAGITYSLQASIFNPIGVTAETGSIGVNLQYLNGSSNTINSNGILMPIDDSDGLTDVQSSSNVIKIEFSLSGNASNPDNTIYDIALHDIEMDCELKKSAFKWELYKNDTLLESGNFAPLFDNTVLNENDDGVIERYVLTTTQQDLTTTTDNYVLYMWISEKCNSNYTLAECLYFEDIEQSNFSNRNFSATLKIEASTKTKKTLTRSTSDVDSCGSSYLTTIAPSGCNTYNSDNGEGLIYNGSTKMFITDDYTQEPIGYTLIGNTATEAGTYQVIAKLNDGYVWSNGSKKDRIYTCSIGKRHIIITAQNQTVSVGDDIDDSLYNVSATGGAVAISGGQYINSLNLYANTYSVGLGEIVPSGAVILDQYGNDVTSNYDILYESGALTVEE